jgi:hypothetical protein
MALTLDGTNGVTFPNSSTQLVAGAPLATPSFTTTIGVGAATASASGAGVTFPATQSTSSNANTLDDYEEGTWTPVFASASGSITGGSKYGSYTKVGNLVSVQIFIGGTFTISSPSGGLTISGFPFVSTAVNNLAIPAFATACYSWNATAYSISVEMPGSATVGYVFNFANGSRGDAGSLVNANTQLIVAGTYLTTT